MEKFVYDKQKLPIPVLKGHDRWLELYDAAWKMAFENVEYIEKEGWLPELTCMPGVGIVWQWDSCFMTMITNYSNGTISALNNLDNLYRLRRESDGFMAMAYNIASEQEEYPGRINPPLLAWAEWQHYVITGDSSRFERVLPALEGLYGFIEKNRRRNTELYYFEDSGSSGMDNAPRGGYFAYDLKGSDMCFIDLAGQQALSAECIGKICGVLGSSEKAEFYAGEHNRICELINKFHWSEKVGFYFDFFCRSEPDGKVKYINSKTLAASWAIISGAAKNEKLERMITHLFNPEEFYTHTPFATLSKDDPNYDSTGGYWLGGVWAPTNYVTIKGLADNGRRALAREAVVKYLNVMCEVYKNPAYTSIWEAYCPEDNRPSTNEKGGVVREHFVGWSGLCPITMLIENIIGITMDATTNTITYDIFPNEEGGLRNFNFCGGMTDIECVKYVPFRNQSIVRVKAEKPFKLVVRTNYHWNPIEIDVPAGENEFMI